MAGIIMETDLLVRAESILTARAGQVYSSLLDDPGWSGARSVMRDLSVTTEDREVTA
jgi:hypothetical protein